MKDLNNSFLQTRGLEISQEKTQIASPPLLKFKFVGYQFSATLRHGRTNIYCYPPNEAVIKLKAKILKVMPPKPQIVRPLNRRPFKIFPTPYIAFMKVNSITRGWSNFYRSANSSNTFSYLRWFIFHAARRYLYHYLSRGNQFKIKKKVNKTALYQFMFQKYLIQPPGKSRYWGIKFTPATGRYKDKTFQLLDLSTVPVKTPSIIEGLSAYHNDDIPKLLKKAVHWKWGIKGRLLLKAKGECTCCHNIIYDTFQAHHFLPLAYGGTNALSNLRAVCTPCHRMIPTRLTKKNIQIVEYYISIGLLSPDVLTYGQETSN